MIERFRVQNYKALQDVTLELTPMHVLIGPNDSGKTSILEALTAISRSVDHPLAASFPGNWSGVQLVWNRTPQLPVSLAPSVSNGDDFFEYGLSVRFTGGARTVQVDGETVKLTFPTEGQIGFNDNRDHTTSFVYSIEHEGRNATAGQRQVSRLVHDSLKGVHYYHWDPHVLSLPVATDAGRHFRMEPSGFGLAQCLDDLLGYDRDQFINLENRFKVLFPQVQSIKLIPESAYRSPATGYDAVPMFSRADGKGIHFQFQGTTELIPAAQVSDGMLMVLAYLTILNLPEPPRLLLIEEPENGIHPARLRDVLTILRELITEQGQSQVILTTHSPYVVDLFQPEEVTLCQKKPDGAIAATRLSESQKVREQMDVFTLGEIWTAEGDQALTAPATPQDITP